MRTVSDGDNLQQGYKRSKRKLKKLDSSYTQNHFLMTGLFSHCKRKLEVTTQISF